jgi:hypothetical protein
VEACAAQEQFGSQIALMSNQDDEFFTILAWITEIV